MGVKNPSNGMEKKPVIKNEDPSPPDKGGRKLFGRNNSRQNNNSDGQQTKKEKFIGA